MQLSDTKDKTEIPLVAGASDKGLTVVTGTRGWGGGGGSGQTQAVRIKWTSLILRS